MHGSDCLRQLSVPHKLVILGAGGHASVVLSLLRASGIEPLGVCDPLLVRNSVSVWQGLPVLGDDSYLDTCNPSDTALALGVGMTVGSDLRSRIYRHWRNKGFTFPALCHPTAWVAEDAGIDDGAQIMAGAVVQPRCIIGENTIVNTRASVDHDCVISADVHVAPGAVICGSVRVGRGAFVGAGAVLIQGIVIGNNSVIGAGATVIRDVPDEVTTLGACYESVKSRRSSNPLKR